MQKTRIHCLLKYSEMFLGLIFIKRAAITVLPYLDIQGLYVT